jgi:DNA-directed RNA polymerase subunit M/transcription elongation factor TFIIS
MDNYARQCIKWLIENDRGLLAHYVNTICGSNDISVEKMDVDGVERVILDATFGSKMKREEDGIKCKSCGKNTVTFFEVQARSADEGASVFYSCTNCLAHWKQR